MSEANRLDHNAAVVVLGDAPRQHRRGDAKHHATALATINEQVLEKKRDDLVRRNEPPCTIDCRHADAVSIVHQPSIGPHLDHGLFAVVDPRLDGLRVHVLCALVHLGVDLNHIDTQGAHDGRKIGSS